MCARERRPATRGVARHLQSERAPSGLAARAMPRSCPGGGAGNLGSKYFATRHAGTVRASRYLHSALPSRTRAATSGSNRSVIYGTAPSEIVCLRSSRVQVEGDRPMYETIILAVCLMQTPSICKEVDISVEPDPTGSLQLPFHCAQRGQIEARSGSKKIRPGRSERWSCHPYG
jgi:hypothetical protein